MPANASSRLNSEPKPIFITAKNNSLTSLLIKINMKNSVKNAAVAQ